MWTFRSHLWGLSSSEIFCSYACSRKAKRYSVLPREGTTEVLVMQRLYIGRRALCTQLSFHYLLASGSSCSKMLICKHNYYTRCVQPPCDSTTLTNEKLLYLLNVNLAASNKQNFVIHRCFFCSSAKQLIRGEPNVSYICSRYYRAPELIFGATDYTSNIGEFL